MRQCIAVDHQTIFTVSAAIPGYGTALVWFGKIYLTQGKILAILYIKCRDSRRFCNRQKRFFYGEELICPQISVGRGLAGCNEPGDVRAGVGWHGQHLGRRY
jgi:hypothetical protein